MRRISAHRDDAEAAIVQTLRKGGASVVLVTTKDAPDLIIGFRGATTLAEVKTGRRKLKPGQVAFAATWRGGPLVTLRTVDDALALLSAHIGRELTWRPEPRR